MKPNIFARLWYALKLSWLVLSWIWACAIGRRVPDNLYTTFHACWHCDTRMSLPGLAYCQPCIDELAAEYAREVAEV